MHIFRVIVRGQFGELDADRRAELVAAAGDHDIPHASFTKEGSFVYTPALTWFNLRYELRSTEADAEADVTECALALTEDRLTAAGIAFKRLRVVAMDMADVWR